MRLDQKIAEMLEVPRNRAQFFIDRWLIQVNGITITKKSYSISEGDRIDIQDHVELRYVSRSALKLAGFLEVFPRSISGTCLDVGSSTGGFTQVLLDQWAERVIALDVGTDQLHPTLRADPRVHSLEQVDIRTWTTPERFLTIVTDVSFISLREVLPYIGYFLQKEGSLIALFKPQFEVGRGNLTASGVPKSETLRVQSLKEFRVYLGDTGWHILHEKESSLMGEAGNREVVFEIGRCG